MAELSQLQFNRMSTSDRLNLKVDFAEMSADRMSPFQILEESGLDLAICQPSSCIRLDLEKLRGFEVVDRQFQQLGVTFTNAIALQPSNPAYSAGSDRMVLMGAPKSGWLEATFLRPVQFVSGSVTSSRSTVMSAFDANNQPLGQTKSPHANLADTKSKLSPNLKLSLSAANIHRITFYTFDGQLTLDEFSFSF